MGGGCLLSPYFNFGVGSWDDRPEAHRAIPNLFLAGGYCRNEVDGPTMDGANETGRRAANAVLEASGSKSAPAKLTPRYVPPTFDLLRQEDADRYRRGRPHVLDAGC